MTDPTHLQDLAKTLRDGAENMYGNSPLSSLRAMRESLQRAMFEASDLLTNQAAESETVDDNWVHRSRGMRCKTCLYFVRKLNEGELGRCRRHSPRPEGGGWHAVLSTDWCGDHKLDGTKVNAK